VFSHDSSVVLVSSDKWKKMFAKLMSNKEFIRAGYEEFLKLSCKKTNNSVRK
jgi:hypothetical protein